jgi:hypothetical protein
MFGMGTEVRWRAWLGMGDESHLSQIDVAEFASCAAACAWVERRLANVWARPGLTVFGSVDRGVYQEATPGAAAHWVLDPHWAGLDADVVDGRVCWRRPGVRVPRC